MRVIIEPDYDKMSKWAADYVAKRIQESKPTADKPFTHIDIKPEHVHILDGNAKDLQKECEDTDH